MKYSVTNETGAESHKRWKDFAIKFKPEDLYVGGIFGMYYNFNIFEFVNKQEPKDFVLVFFISNSIGTDKLRILITSNQLITDEQIKSLPFTYVSVNNPSFNKTVLEDFLNKLDEQFKANNKSISLVLNLPLGYLDVSKLTNIQVIASEHPDIDKGKIALLTKYFKTNYRKLQITKYLQKMQGKLSNFSFVEYMSLISMAWNNVPYGFIRKLFYYNEGGISNWNETNDLSLSHWCKQNKVPINNDLHDSFENYVSIDDTLNVFDSTITESDFSNTENKKISQSNSVTVSGIEAYQAMKRLISYIQSKRADSAIMIPARCLEDHLEYEALQEMHQYVKSENDNTEN